jgi:hypothetical protein
VGRRDRRGDRDRRDRRPAARPSCCPAVADRGTTDGLRCDIDFVQIRDICRSTSSTCSRRSSLGTLGGAAGIALASPSPASYTAARHQQLAAAIAIGAITGLSPAGARSSAALPNIRERTRRRILPLRHGSHPQLHEGDGSERWSTCGGEEHGARHRSRPHPVARRRGFNPDRRNRATQRSGDLAGRVLRPRPARRYAAIGCGRNRIFYRFMTTLDYPGQELVLRRKTSTQLRSFRAEARRAGAEVLPLWLATDHLACTLGSLNEYGPRIVLLDTGGIGIGLVTTKQFAQLSGIEVDYANPIPAASSRSSPTRSALATRFVETSLVSSAHLFWTSSRSKSSVASPTSSTSHSPSPSTSST